MPLVIFTVLAAIAVAGPPPRFPTAASEEAWALMPRESPPLPAWARILVKPLPRTTAAMLEQDRLHRAENPLGAELAAKLRWVAADAIGCEYGRATSARASRRAGASADDVRRLTGGEPSPGEKATFAFARKVSKAAYTVTDDEFAVLLKHFGPEKVTAIVETLAFANFQYRVIMAIGAAVESDGPYPPLEVRFDIKKRAKVPTPPRPPWERAISVRPRKSYDAPAEWKEVSFAELEECLAKQKARTPRIPVPGADRFKDLSPDLKKQTDAIVWSKVTAGYQPVLTEAWFAGLREFQQEAKMDPVFGRTLFWIVTRANDCFY